MVPGDNSAESPEPAKDQLAEGDGDEESASGEEAPETAVTVEEEDAPDAAVESELPADKSDPEVEAEPAAEDESQQSEEGESAAADSTEEEAEDS